MKTLLLVAAACLSGCASRSVVASDAAPKAIGPYSQAIAAGSMVYCAGQLGMDPATGKLVEGGVEAETERALKNLEAVLRAAGLGMDRVVKTTVYMTDLAEFAKMNEVYARFFPANPPARATVQVAALPKGGRVEIDAVAVR